MCELVAGLLEGQSQVPVRGGCGRLGESTPETKAENLPHRLLQGFPLVLVLHLGYALPRLTPAIRHGAFGTLARFVSSQVGSGSCQPGLLKIDMSSTPQIAHPGGNERKIPWC